MAKFYFEIIQNNLGHFFSKLVEDIGIVDF
jgi:hypothetical protein